MKRQGDHLGGCYKGLWVRSHSEWRGRSNSSRGKTGRTKHQNGGVWLGDWGESNCLAWVAGEMVEPFAGPRTLGKELSWRAETVSSALVVSEMLVGCSPPEICFLIFFVLSTWNVISPPLHLLNSPPTPGSV